MVLRMSSYVEVKAGISLHPGHPAINSMLKVDEERLLKDVKCPQMFMPAIDDHESTKLGGLGKKILTDGLEVIEFPEINHGWTATGISSEGGQRERGGWTGRQTDVRLG